MRSSCTWGTASRWRRCGIRKLIVEPGSTLMAYEESKWAEALDYQRQNAEDSLQIIKYARQTTYRLLKTLPEAVFEQLGDTSGDDRALHVRHVAGHLCPPHPGSRESDAEGLRGLEEALSD